MATVTKQINGDFGFYLDFKDNDFGLSVEEALAFYKENYKANCSDLQDYINKGRVKATKDESGMLVITYEDSYDITRTIERIENLQKRNTILSIIKHIITSTMIREQAEDIANDIIPVYAPVNEYEQVLARPKKILDYLRIEDNLELGSSDSVRKKALDKFASMGYDINKENLWLNHEVALFRAVLVLKENKSFSIIDAEIY